MSGAMMVSGLDITVRECVFRHALRNASTSVILNFNHENTDLLEYLADRKIREELPSARFSPNEICNTYYRIENDELKYHVMCEAFRLLKDVSAELGTELNLETYRVLSEPEGFENALEILNSRGKNTTAFRSRYARLAEIFNTADVLIETCAPELESGTFYYIASRRASDTPDNAVTFRKINAALTAFPAPITLIVNEGAVNHMNDLNVMIKNSVDSANITVIYFSNNAFSCNEPEKFLAYFSQVLFTRHNLPAAQLISKYFGSRDVCEKRTSVSHDDRLFAYSLPDVLLQRNHTTTTTTEVRNKLFVEPERIANLPDGNVIMNSGGKFCITSIRRLLI